MLRVALGIAIALAGVAYADDEPSPENQKRADKFFQEGRDLLVNQKNAPAACEKFRQAIALDPTAPGVMLNLGLCYETQGKFATSLYWFRKAQFAASEAKNPQPGYEEEAKTHTKDLATKVLITKINVEQAPATVRISIDGRPVRQEEYNRLEVDSDSEIEARAAGKDVFRQQVEVENGVAREIQLVMKDQPLAPMKDPGAGRRRFAYIVGAGGVVIWGVTLAYGLIIRGRYDDLNDGHYDEENGFQTATDDLRLWGTTLFVAGTLTVGAAVVLYLTAPKPYRERIEQAHIVPIVTPDQYGLGYARAF